MLVYIYIYQLAIHQKLIQHCKSNNKVNQIYLNKN